MKMKPKGSDTRLSSIMKVRVAAGANKETVKRIGTTFVITVKEPPEANRANDRVRQILSSELMVPLRAVRIMSGHHRPSKSFEIIGVS